MDDESAREQQEDDAVGYRRPPKAHQFKKGKSGNPRGRRKGAKGIGEIVRKAMDAKIDVRSGDRIRKISAAEGVLSRLFNSAIKGDHKATEQAVRLMERHGITATAETEEGNFELERLTDEELDMWGYLVHKCWAKEELFDEQQREIYRSRCQNFREGLKNKYFSDN